MKFVNWLNLEYLRDKRFWIIAALGFSAGLPLGLTGSTLQAWFAMDNVDIVTIGALSLIGQPYAYKFLWSPFMDRWQLPGGRRRGWLALTQIGLMILLGLMSICSPSTTPSMLFLLGICVAFCSASQDIAVDAYRTELLEPSERGNGAAMFVAGYRIAMLVSGGLTLVMAEFLGYSPTYLICAAMMLIGLLATRSGPEPTTERPPSNLKSAFIEPMREFLSRDKALWLLLLVVLYKLADAFALSLTTAFLLKGVGFSQIDVGLINKTVGLGATLVGVFLGGALLAKHGLYKSLIWFGVLQGVSNLAYFALSLVGPNYLMMVFTIFVEYLCGGMGTAAYLALLMSLCHPKYTATQFALLSALSAIGRVYVGPAAGMMVASVGWSQFFLWTVFWCLPGLALLWFLKPVIVSLDFRKASAEEEELEALT